MEDIAAELRAAIDGDFNAGQIRTATWRFATLAADEIDRLKQMMWDAYGIMGFDQDGCESYRHAVGWPDSHESFLDAVRKFRKEYDELLEEVPLP